MDRFHFKKTSWYETFIRKITSVIYIENVPKMVLWAVQILINLTKEEIGVNLISTFFRKPTCFLGEWISQNLWIYLEIVFPILIWKRFFSELILRLASFSLLKYALHRRLHSIVSPWSSFFRHKACTVCLLCQCGVCMNVPLLIDISKSETRTKLQFQ